MRLNEYEMRFLKRFIGEIDIQMIPGGYFMIALIMRDRLTDALRAIQTRRCANERQQG